MLCSNSFGVVCMADNEFEELRAVMVLALSLIAIAMMVWLLLMLEQMRKRCWLAGTIEARYVYAPTIAFDTIVSKSIKRISFDTIVSKYVKGYAVSFDTITSKSVKPPAISFDTLVSKYVPPPTALSFDVITSKYVPPPALVSFDTLVSKYVPPPVSLSFDTIVSKYIKPLAFDVITSKYVPPSSYTVTISNNTGSNVQTIVIADPKLSAWGKNILFEDSLGSLPSLFVYNGVWVVKLRNPLPSGQSISIKAYNKPPYIDPSIALAYLDFETDPAFTKTANFEYVLEAGFDGTRLRFRTADGGDAYAYKSIPVVSDFRILALFYRTATGSYTDTKALLMYYNDTSNFYAFVYKWYGAVTYICIEKMVGGTWASLTSKAITQDLYVAYGIKAGSSLVFKMLKNGSLVDSVSVTDTSLTQFNLYGLLAWGTTTNYGYVDNLIVLPYEPDPSVTVS